MVFGKWDSETPKLYSETGSGIWKLGPRRSNHAIYWPKGVADLIPSEAGLTFVCSPGVHEVAVNPLLKKRCTSFDV